MADDKEIWKAHPEYPIDVSTHGRVRSHRTGKLYAISDSTVRRKGHPRGEGKREDYKRVSTGTRRAANGRGVRAYVHTVVLETFVGPRPEGYEADHEDFDPSNNHLSNLAWIPAEENRARKRTRNFQLTR